MTTTSRQKIDIVFQDIEYSVKDHSTGQIKHILRGVSGQVKSGQVLAIMGASGAGKSTFMNILSGQIQKKDPNSTLKGEVLYNGREYSLNQVKTFSGYVMQTDNLLEFMTVKETISFAVNLKFKGTQKEKD
jgi:ABC-type multidrug transport system ATPase subunit